MSTATAAPGGPDLKEKIEEELTRGEHISIIALVDNLIEYAEQSRASDIHINPRHDLLQVRMRIDGVLQDSFAIPKNIHQEVISRIKVLAGLRTDEHQAAQDGRFRVVTAKGEPVDVRVSITPTYYGENSVLRLLANNSAEFTLTSLGFSPEDQKKIIKAIKRPHGMILSTGPTGSGKTTTLYTVIKMLNTPEVSIVTIEDPIEYAISDITQIQINPHSGLTFAKGLRSILRQDPNIIMVGEIRDAETAGIAVNTALTGHLLLSTLHTSDSATTLPRLLDMGVDSYLVASTVHLAIGQRLVRKLCIACIGKGCDACQESGFRGRIGINEVLVVDDEVREAILRKESAVVIKKIAIKNGMTTMLEDGMHKVAAGLTTKEEVLRVINE
jgi:type II secretory ATPase GspE/PulE/Tfp pilus assembly ATPase PilB-like protein